MAAAQTIKIAKQFCEPCSYDKIEISATAFCTSCTEYLCKDCTKGHRRNKVTRHHQTLEGDDFPNDPSNFKLMKKLTSCSDHIDIPVTFKCDDHDTFICTTCLALKHRKCENITEICNADNSADTKCVEEKLVRRIDDLRKKTAATRLSKEENITTLRTDEENITVNLEQINTEIKKYYNNLLKKSKAELKVTTSGEIKTLRSCIDKCRVIEEEERQKEGLLDVAIHHGSDIENRIIQEIVTQDINRLENEVHLQSKIENVRLKLSRNGAYKTIYTIGSVTTEHENDLSENTALSARRNILENASDAVDELCSNTKSNQNSLHQKTGLCRTKHTTAEPQPTPCRSLPEKMIGENATNYSVKHEDKHTWAISRIIPLTDGRLVLGDMNNKHIRVINEQFSESFTYGLNASPIDLCEVSSNNIAVIFSDSCKVSILLITDSEIQDHGGFPTKLLPLSISQYNADDMEAMIMFSGRTIGSKKKSGAEDIEIQIRNYRDGQVKLVINDFKTPSLKSMVLHNPKRIYVTPGNRRKILISEHNILRCFEKSGSFLKQVWYVRSHDKVNLDNITDVVADTDGNPYICCLDSDSIIQISSRNFLINRVISTNIQRPLALAINEEREKIYVSTKNTSCISSYDFNPSLFSPRTPVKWSSVTQLCFS